MKFEHREELDWLAFRYLANELSASEQEAFEDRLADDQSAREAVAKAVELTQTLSAARELDEIVIRSVEAPMPAEKGRIVWSVPAAWMSVGAAACLLLVAIWSLPSVLNDHWSNSGGAMVANAHTLELARAWSSARDEFAAHEGNFWDRDAARSEHAPAEAAIVSAPSDDELDDMDPVPMPSWMLSAVEAEALDIPGANQNEIREN